MSMSETFHKLEIWNSKRRRDDLMPANILVYVVPADTDASRLMTALHEQPEFRCHVETAELNPDFPVDAAVLALAHPPTLANSTATVVIDAREEIQDMRAWRLPRPTEGRHSLNTATDSGVE